MSTDLDTPAPTDEPTAPPEALAPPETPETPPAPVDEDTALDQQLEAQAIAVPDGDKLVPLSAVTTLRGKVKALRDELLSTKTSADRAGQLEQQITQLQGQLQQITPMAQAYQAAVAAQQTPPAAPEDDTEAREFAQALDLYTADGQPDVKRAQKILGVVDKRAESKADARVAPMQQESVQQKAAITLARAKLTTLPDGSQADPAILENLWSRVDPALSGTTDGAMHLYAQAYAFTMMNKAKQGAGAPGSAPRLPNGQFAAPAAPEIPAPLYSEKAGGRNTPDVLPLSDQERRVMKQLGMTEQEYFESAKTMPGGRR